MSTSDAFFFPALRSEALALNSRRLVVSRQEFHKDGDVDGTYKIVSNMKHFAADVALLGEEGHVDKSLDGRTVLASLHFDDDEGSDVPQVKDGQSIIEGNTSTLVGGRAVFPLLKVLPLSSFNGNRSFRIHFVVDSLVARGMPVRVVTKLNRWKRSAPIEACPKKVRTAASTEDAAVAGKLVALSSISALAASGSESLVFGMGM